MQKTEHTVVDGTKMTDEQLRKLTRRSDELKRHINEGTLPYDWVMDELQQVIEGRKSEQSQAAPGVTSIVADCGADPLIRSRLSLEGEGVEHRRMGKVTLEKRNDGKLYANGVEVVRYLSPNQERGGHIQGHELRKELEDKRVLNACFLDVLLVTPRLIPDEWKIGYTYFWGTVFSSTADTFSLFVENLYWHGVRWYCNYAWLNNDRWDDLEPAAVLAS